jgi:heme exporter protein B
MKGGLFDAALTILKKDLAIELRTGEVVLSTALFATLVTVIASLSFYVDEQSARQVAPGVLWIAVAFAGVLAMGRTFQRERENDAMRALLLAPVPRAAIFLGKALGTLLFMSVVEALLVLEVGVLFNLDLLRVAGPLCLLLVLGTIGFVSTGTLFAALGVRTRSRDMALAIALFPITAPALLCGVVASRELFAGAPLSEISDWLRILTATDIAFVTVGLLLFEPLMND